MSKSDTCPNCGEAAIVRTRPWYGWVFGPLLIFIGFVLWIATLGLSFVLTLFGTFLWVPRKSCESCGWRQRDSKRR